MPHEIRVPRLGWSMEEGVFLGWCKQPGEPVAVGDPLFVLEGEKAAQDIESLDAGVLFVPPDAPEPGAVVPVGGLLGYLLAPDESPPEPAKAIPLAGAESHVEMEGPERRAAAMPPAGPSVRRLARELGVNLKGLAGSGPAGRIRREDVIRQVRLGRESVLEVTGAATSSLPSGSGSERMLATPRAKRVARELGVNWRTLHGSGRGGRIREADVRNASRSLPTREGPRTDRTPVTPAGHSIVTHRRKTIAARLRRSLERTVPVTLTTVADVTNLVALRAQFKAASTSLVPSYTDFVAILVSHVLVRHPRLALRWNQDRENWEPIGEGPVDIGMAVDAPDGLLVPILRDVAHKSLTEVARESQDLIQRARSSRLTAAEMQGGVLTITNLGGLGIDAFTPIIQYPEIAILGLGAIRREPVVLPDDRIVPRERMTLSLTFDHAAADGAPAAAFLHDVACTMENAAAHLLDRA